VEVQTHGF